MCQATINQHFENVLLRSGKCFKMTYVHIQLTKPSSGRTVVIMMGSKEIVRGHYYEVAKLAEGGVDKWINQNIGLFNMIVH